MSSELTSLDEYHAQVAKAMPESELQATVEAMLDQFGWLWFHHNDKGNKILAKLRRWYAMSKGKGFFDILAIRGGICLFIELKTEDGHLAKAQREWRDAALDVEDRCTGAIGAAPVRYLLWRPRHLCNGEIERVLRGESSS